MAPFAIPGRRLGELKVMGESTSSPRFRIRLEDGAELPINSVEALARRVAGGDVDPKTSLYDGSTGKWLKAADAPVVRFILEEMERDGAELPPAWESESTADVTADPPQGPPPPSEDQGSDPLEIGLTLAPLDDITKDAEEVGDQGSAAPSAVPAPIEAGERDLITPRSIGGVFSTAGSEASSVGTGTPVGVGRVDSESPASPVGSDRPWESRGARKEWWLVGFLIGAVALVGMGLLLGDIQRVDQSTLSGAEGRQSGVSGVETDPEPGVHTWGCFPLSATRT